jgi:hypothetical protein
MCNKSHWECDFIRNVAERWPGAVGLKRAAAFCGGLGLVVINSLKSLRLSAGLLLAAFIGSTPAWSQSWNAYQPYTNSFFVPFVAGPNTPNVTAPDTLRYVDLTLITLATQPKRLPS